MYEHIVYDGFEFATIAEVAPALYERTLTVNGASKAYAMTGWRIGYAGGPAALIKGIAKIQSQTTSNPCSISMAATVAALNGDQSFLAARNAAFAVRRDLVVTARSTPFPGLRCPTPEGAFYVYPDCAELIGRTTPDGVALADDTAVATLPARCRGRRRRAGKRASAARRRSASAMRRPTRRLAEAMTRIARGGRPVALTPEVPTSIIRP